MVFFIEFLSLYDVVKFCLLKAIVYVDFSGVLSIFIVCTFFNTFM